MPISIDNNYMNSDHSRIGYNSSSSGAQSVGDSGSLPYGRSGSAPAPGSVVSGEIIEKDGDQVTIRLGNDQTISAKLQGNANIEVGMRMTFEVAKGSDNRMALRPLYSNLANNSTAMSALKAAGLPINDTTLAMTDKMMAESMPVNRNALTDMFRSVSAHPNASPESIVQMTKLNMPLTETNVIQFDNYRNFEHQITSDLQNVSDGIAELFKEALSGSESITGDASQTFGNLSAGDVVNEVLNLIDTDSLETIMPEKAVVPEETVLVTDVAGEPTVESAVTGLVNENGTPVINENATGVTGNVTNPVAGETSSETLTVAADNTTTVINENGTAPLNENATVITNEDGVTPAIENGVSSTIKNTVDSFITGLKEMFTSDSGEAQPAIPVNENLSLTPKEQASVASDLSEVLSMAGKETDVSKPLDPAQVMKAVRELVKEYGPIKGATTQGITGDTAEAQVKETINEKLGQLLKSDGFSKLLKDSVKAQMSIKPQDVAGEGKIEELYEKIRSTSERISEMMSTIGREDSAAAKSANALGDNVNFMNQLNEFVNYVQLPLKMAGEDANGELYVYTKKKNLSENNGNFSALLHLDMDHLGPMDIYVTMRDYTKVNTNFYLQSEELLDFIESHIDELTKRLTDKGYDTSTRVTKKNPGEAITPIADEFTKEEATSSAPVAVAKMRFDVRA